MDQKQRTKLELIRIEGIWRMLLKKIKDEVQLTSWVDSVTNASTKDVKKAIARLTRYQLIKIIEFAGNAITPEDIDEAYEQYRYGLKPGFTLFNIQSFKDIDEDTAYRAIGSFLSEIPYPEGVAIKAIATKSHSWIDSSVIEFAFYYHIKYSYLSEEEEPLFIYEYKECFAWIDAANGFLVIQNAPDKVTTIIRNAFAKVYTASMTSVKLTQRLIDEVFGSEKIKKGTYINPNASDLQAEKVTLADSRLAEKQSVQQSVSGYDMTGTYLNQTVGDEPNTLGINCKKGKLYLTSNVSATLFREWSIEKIKSIITYLRSKADYVDFDIFQAKNSTDLLVWDKYKAPQKRLIEQMLYAVYVAHFNQQDSADILFSASDLRQTMKSFFHERLCAHCNHCDEPFIPRCGCNGLLTIEKSGTLRCLDCGQEIDSVQCDDGHQVIIDGANTLSLFPNSLLLRSIKITLKNAFDVTMTGSFNISENRLTLISEQSGHLILPDDIPELKSVIDLDITDGNRESLLEQSKLIKENCRRSVTNSDCNTCDSVAQRCCMMKLFTTFPGYRPSPHQASEFGDVSFSVTLNGIQRRLVGIAKSATGKDTLSLSDQPAREMLQQVLTATHDARIGVIAVICPMRFHDQFVEELRYIADLTRKPLVVLDDQYMVYQVLAYQEMQKNLK